MVKKTCCLFPFFRYTLQGKILIEEKGWPCSYSCCTLYPPLCMEGGEGRWCSIAGTEGELSTAEVLSAGSPVAQNCWNGSVADPNPTLFCMGIRLKNRLLSMRKKRKPRNCIIKSILRLQARSTSVPLLGHLFLSGSSAPVFTRICPFFYEKWANMTEFCKPRHVFALAVSAVVLAFLPVAVECMAWCEKRMLQPHQSQGNGVSRSNMPSPRNSKETLHHLSKDKVVLVLFILLQPKHTKLSSSDA